MACTTFVKSEALESQLQRGIRALRWHALPATKGRNGGCLNGKVTFARQRKWPLGLAVVSEQ